MAMAIESRTVQKVKIWQFLDIQLGCWRYLTAEQCKCLQDASDSHHATVNLEGKLKVNFPNNEMEIITSKYR